MMATRTLLATWVGQCMIIVAVGLRVHNSRIEAWMKLMTNLGEDEAWMVGMRASAAIAEPVSFIHGPVEIEGDHVKVPKMATKCKRLGIGRNTVRMNCEEGILCMSGKGFQSRAKAMIAMIHDASEHLISSGKAVPDFPTKTIAIWDKPNKECTYDFAFDLPWDSNCTALLVPDNNFWAVPEQGIVPSFAKVTSNLNEIANSPPSTQRCGWAGNPGNHGERYDFIEMVSDRAEFDFNLMLPQHGGSNNETNRMTIEEMAQKWACLIDLPGNGWSGRVPFLMHMGRPLLMLERGNIGCQKPDAYGTGKWGYVDRTFYADLLEPWVNFIPVNMTLESINQAVAVALSEQGRQIGLNMLQTAKQHLTSSNITDWYANLLEHINE